MKLLLSYGSNADNYINALQALGAEVVAKYLPEADTSYDGLILAGGEDVDPTRYGEEIDGARGINYERDEAEFALLAAYVEAGKPVLGICRGHQLINVFFGGTLYQDMPVAELHRTQNKKDAVHEIMACEDSVVGRLYGERFCVNSSHHQAVKALGRDLVAGAYWDGAYIEAIEHRTLPILGVQWHPERMCFSHAREDTVSGVDLLKHFIEMCEKHNNM